MSDHPEFWNEEMETLSPERYREIQEKALLKELGKKCRVYGDGCIKRGKIEEGEYYLSLVKNLLNHEPH